MGKATHDLRKEHDAILHVLQILERMMTPGYKQDIDRFPYYQELVYFLQIFADKCHHGKEENYLFVELINNGVPNEGGPVGVMLHEHKQGREYIALMNKAVEERDIQAFHDAAEKYTDLLRNHINKENNILFVMADKLIEEAKQNELFEKFEEHEKSVIGYGVHEELHAMMHKWAEVFTVH